MAATAEHPTPLFSRQAARGREDEQPLFSSGDITFVGDLALPPDGDIATSADAYFLTSLLDTPPASSCCLQAAAPAPLALVLPGAFGPKELYSALAHSLAAAGNVVLVLQQLRPLPFPPPILIGDATAPQNVVSATVVQAALDFVAESAGKASLPAIDLNAVHLIGHSLGAVTIAEAVGLRGEDLFPGVLNSRSDDLQALSGILSSFFYGYRGSDILTNKMPSGSVVPTLIVNGERDGVANTTTHNLDVYSQPAAAAMIRGLDHFSIADAQWLRRDRETPSVLPRDVQTGSVGALAAAWGKVAAASAGDAGAAAALRKAAQDAPFVLANAIANVAEWRADLTGLDLSTLGVQKRPAR